MKTINKIYILLVAIGLIAGVFASFNSAPVVQTRELNNQISLSNSEDSGTNVNVHYDGYVTVKKTDALTGEITTLPSKHNLITNDGLSFITRKLYGTDGNATNKTTVVTLAGNGTTPSASWTQISNEMTTTGFSRNITATVTTNGTNGYNVTASWTATGSQNLNMTGLEWQNQYGSNNDLFAVLAFTDQSMLVNDQLQVVWSIVVS